jgi:Type I phosphodiesterase / nucleotide pyrophosphatase
MTLLVVIGVLGLPAALLRFLCVGHSCDEETATASEVPFCSLDSELRSRITAGFREGRSPEVFAVARRTAIAGGTGYEGSILPLWPSRDLDSARVPIVFAGEGVVHTPISQGTTLASIAPTLAAIIDFERPFPEVRSGEAIEGVAGDSSPRLLLQVILKGVGSDDLEAEPDAWPFLRGLMEEGAATMDADTGSLPLDPAAAISTIGTGGPPSQHGITGEFVRTGEGRLVRSFSNEAETPVIATLADDLDEELDQRPLIGLVGATATDRGAVGGEWYGSSSDVDKVVIARRDQVGLTAEMLSGRSVEFGADRVPDLMSVVMEGNIPRLDRGLERIVAAAEEAADGSVALVVTATGSVASSQTADGIEIVRGTEIAHELDEAVGERVVEAAVPGGLFLDQRALTELELSEDIVIKELERLRGPEGYLFEDVWPAIAVTFARFC